ncbi:MAG: Na+/H+ antiporter NhaC family protein [Leptolyngbyaceae cyanobacterium SM2_5_2]|nr:Na+/H+ antiporter NhaC family protein [Leptolyngbyaceae cyanobacterium SM2_5_2]
MDRVLALGLSAGLLIITAVEGGWLLPPLALSVLGFVGLYWWRGMAPAQLVAMLGRGARQSFGVLSILLLIGGLTAAWMAAGTVATLVYYGLQLIQPRLFILSAFVLTGAVSILIGTSFGTVGTIGLALMIMARGGGVSPPWVAGAIIAGAYVGDRCSPLSSSAYLVATLTETNLYANLRVMATTAMVPWLLSAGIYLVASWQHPLVVGDQGFWTDIPTAFSLHWVTLLPAVLIFGLVALRVPVKLTLLLSLGLASGIAIGWQGYSPRQLGSFLIFGFELGSSTELADILRGGGIWPMAKVGLLVMVSTALAGLLAETETLSALQNWLKTLRPGRPLLVGTLATSLASAAYGCTQTMAILLTYQLTQPSYRQAHLSAQRQAIDLENTAVVLSPLIPWNIAGLIPATLLMVNAEFIPFAVYLYLLPLWELGCRPQRLRLLSPATQANQPDLVRPAKP